MATLFEPLTLRGRTFRNRVFVSPMCQYSSRDGLANMWHAVHLGARAVGGAGLVCAEATAVVPEGRISPQDLGLWSDAHADSLAPVVRFIHSQGRAAGIQLAHAGRKGSTRRPWDGHGQVEDGGWEPVGPTGDRFAADYPVPRALTRGEIADVVSAFVAAAVRARDVGFDVVEIHAAHGYLIHEFLSPLSNSRTDEYGGSLDGRLRLCLEVVDAVRAVWPDDRPLFVRISASDWTDGGWDLDQSVTLAGELKRRGVDLIDCSSGGNVERASIPLGPGYQVPFAERIRRDVGIPTGAVGLITDPTQANDIVAAGRADAVFLARELLRDPYWPLHAAQALGVGIDWPAQYLRAAPGGTVSRGAGELEGLGSESEGIRG